MNPTTANTVIVGFLMAIALGMGFGVSPAAAQGCPWCVTPTTCATVNETAAHSCTVTAEEGCDINGFCIIAQATPNMDIGSETNAFAELVQNGTKTIDTEPWGSVEFARIEDDLYGLWSCSGSLIAMALVDGNVVRHLGPNS